MQASRNLAPLHYLGFIVMLVGLAMVAPITVTLLARGGISWPAYLAFVLPAVLATAAGFLLSRLPSTGGMDFRVALATSALIWLVAPLVAAVPYLVGLGMNFVDAYFEAMSGFTTTGLTMIPDIESIPPEIQFWRSLTEWLGGAGIVLLFLSILAEPGVASLKLYQAEARTERISPNIVGTARTIWWIYGIYTALGVGLLYLVGMPLFEAVNHGMTGIATGGFSVKNAGIRAYGDLRVEAVLLALMVLGTISFSIHYSLIARGRLEMLLRSSEVRFLAAVIAVASALIFLSLILAGGYEAEGAWRVALFQAVSGVTTTGFTTVKLGELPEFVKALLLLLMIIGGGYGSTSGALKLVRTVIILKVIADSVKKLFLPRGAVKPIMVNGEPIEEEQILGVLRFAVLYGVMLLAGTLAMTALGFSFFDSFFEVASAQGNVGFSSGITTPELHPVGKVILIVMMWSGRLEIVPVLFLLVFGVRSLKGRVSQP